MTSTNKFTWGVLLNISGVLLFFGGIALSFTLIGACLGIPMALVGLPLLIWGIVWLFQAQSQRAQEAITAGIQRGLQYATAREVGAAPILQASAPPPLPAADPIAVAPIPRFEPPPMSMETTESPAASQPSELSTDEGSESKDPPQ